MKKVLPGSDLGGETANLYNTISWEETELGAYEHWPQPLRLLVNTMLGCPIPMYICWGPSRIFLYNDAYRLLLAQKHPHALGRRFEDVWPEVWPNLQPLFQKVAAGENCYFENMPMTLERHGYPENGFFTFSFNPIQDGDGPPVGLQCICFETTDKIQLMQKAEQASQQLENYFRQAPMATAIMEGPDHVFKFSNSLYDQMVGNRPLLGLSIREAFPDLEGQPFYGILDEVYNSGQPHVAREALVQLEYVDGTKDELYLDFIYAPRLTPASQVEGISVLIVDVTDKVLARRLAESKTQEMTQLANSMPQIVWSSDASGEAEYFNDRWHEYTGFPRDSESRNWLSALHAKDRRRVEDLWRLSLSSSRSLSVEARLRHAHTQSYRWFQIEAVPWRNPEGQITRWYGSCTDIHELRLMTEQLVEAREKFTTIFKNTRSALALCKDSQFILEKVNPAFTKLFGERDFLGVPLIEACPELSSTPFFQKMHEVYQSGQPYRSKEETFPLDHSRFFDLSISRVQSVDEVTDGILLDLNEVTERVLFRKKIEDSEEWLRLATRAARIGIWDLDHLQHTVTFSERASEIFGIDGAGIFPLADLIAKMHPDDVRKVEQSLEFALDPEGSGEYDVTHRILMNDGSVRWVSAFGQARPGLRLTGSILDITAEVEAHNEVISAREAADNANSAKSAFLANMSHEIRSPLGAIMGFVELLKDQDLDPLESAEYLGVIERNSQQLLRIIDDILDLSKVEAGKMLVEQVEFSLPELLADFASLMGFKARENGIDFMLRAETPLPDRIISDSTRLRQILNNVVGNAIKFTSKGFVELAISYQHPKLRLRVRDTGVGISEEQAAQLFQAFGQADASTTRKFGGTGLGLVLTRKLSQMLGGNFWLDSSEPGKGSVFIAELEIDRPDVAVLMREAQFRYTTNPTRSFGGEAGQLEGLRVLVVEDSLDNQKLLTVLLTRLGAKVELADDGWMGMTRALEGDFHIVLMDVQMPRMDGYEAVQRLREQNFQLPIIALTAHAMQEEREKCLRAGYTDFLSKPIDRSRLLDMMKSQVSLH